MPQKYAFLFEKETLYVGKINKREMLTNENCR